MRMYQIMGDVIYNDITNPEDERSNCLLDTIFSTKRIDKLFYNTNNNLISFYVENIQKITDPELLIDRLRSLSDYDAYLLSKKIEQYVDAYDDNFGRFNKVFEPSNLKSLPPDSLKYKKFQ